MKGPVCIYMYTYIYGWYIIWSVHMVDIEKRNILYVRHEAGMYHMYARYAFLLVLENNIYNHGAWNSELIQH